MRAAAHASNNAQARMHTHSRSSNKKRQKHGITRACICKPHAKYRSDEAGKILPRISDLILCHFHTAHTLLPCAGLFVAGAIGTNVCPAGSTRIDTESLCMQASASYGQPYDPDFTTWPSAAHPRGCMGGINAGKVYFNPTPTGQGNSKFAPLCYRGNPVAPTTALPITATSTMIPTTATPMTRPHCTVLWDSCPPFLPSGPAVCECLGVATVLCSQRCVFVS